MPLVGVCTLSSLYIELSIKYQLLLLLSCRGYIEAVWDGPISDKICHNMITRYTFSKYYSIICTIIFVLNLTQNNSVKIATSLDFGKLTNVTRL